MPTGYIYLITNLVNYKCYVGQTTKIPEQRWEEHIRWSRTQRVYLSHAIKRYGPEHFALGVLAVVDCQSDTELKKVVNELEKLWIICLRSCESEYGYNMTFGGEGGKPTDVVRQKIGAANRGRKWTPELRERIMAARSLKPHANQGKKLPQYQIEALRRTHLGKPLADSAKEKIRQRQTGRKLPASWRESIRQGLKNARRCAFIKSDGAQCGQRANAAQPRCFLHL